MSTSIPSLLERLLKRYRHIRAKLGFRLISREYFDLLEIYKTQAASASPQSSSQEQALARQHALRQLQYACKSGHTDAALH